MFFIKVYDREHNSLDEISEIEVKSYSNTLNGVNKMIFNIPLMCEKFTSKNFTEFNHVELYEDNKLKWFGVMTNINFNNPSVEIGCMGYLHLLEKLRLKAKTYNNYKYSNLIMRLLEDAECQNGIIQGEVYGDSATTTRIIENTDMYLDKIMEFLEEMNYYVDVDKDRMLNFYSNKGKDKTHLVLQKSEEYSNILQTPAIAKGTDELANSIYAETTYQNDAGVDVTMTTEQKDLDSINKYGLHQAVLSTNDIRLQETLVSYTKAELERRAYPLMSITLECTDSAICPIECIDVGDWITIYLEDYFNLRQKIRVIEIERDCLSNKYKVTLGNVLYRENKIKAKVYTI